MKKISKFIVYFISYLYFIQWHVIGVKKSSKIRQVLKKLDKKQKITTS